MPKNKTPNKPEKQPEQPGNQPDYKKLYLQEHLKALRIELNFIQARAQIITGEINQASAEIAQHLVETGQAK